MLYQYIKAKPKRPIRRPLVFSFLLMSVGMGILLWVAWPIVSFTIFSAPLFGAIVSPMASTGEGVRTKSVLPQIVAATGAEPTSESINPDTIGVDYTNANLWYPTSPQKKVVAQVNSYTLSIPKLKIENAVVIIAGEDLNKSLIHYGGTGLPGEYGNTVIFGHSVLPQFFDPKNYRTIFSTLPTITIGDDLFITYDSVTYKYKVFDMVVRDPTDLGALEQQYDDSYVTLVTCVPPGTYWKRLNVKARLVRI